MRPTIVVEVVGQAGRDRRVGACAMLDRGLQRLRSAGVQNIVDPVLRHTTPQSLQIGAGVRMRLAEDDVIRSEEHTSELQSLMRISYAVFCLKKKITHNHIKKTTEETHHID